MRLIETPQASPRTMLIRLLPLTPKKRSPMPITHPPFFPRMIALARMREMFEREGGTLLEGYKHFTQPPFA